MTHIYGYRRDLPDHRDRVLTVAPQNLPPVVDLREQCPPVYDLGALGSCSANALAGALEFDQMKQGITPVFTPSRLFIYWNERQLERSVMSDSGATLRDGMKTINRQGACSEDLWPYDISQ